MFENRGRGIGEKGKDNGLLVLVAVKEQASPGRGWVQPRAVHQRRLCRRGQPQRHGAVFRARRVRPRGARGRHAHHRTNRAGPRRYAHRRTDARAGERTPVGDEPVDHLGDHRHRHTDEQRRRPAVARFGADGRTGAAARGADGTAASDHLAAEGASVEGASAAGLAGSAADGSGGGGGGASW